jgi:hypothetical protein
MRAHLRTADRNFVDETRAPKASKKKRLLFLMLSPMFAAMAVQTVAARLLPRTFLIDAGDGVRVCHEGIEEAAPFLR